MATPTPEPALQDILTRLKRIEGQVRGLQEMIQQERDCEAILTQVRAVQAALRAVGGLVLHHYLAQCREEWEKEPDPRTLERKLRRAVELLTKFMGG